MALSYLLDEHLPIAYREQLLRRRPELVVWSIGDPGAPPRGTLDPAILAWCEQSEFVLVTSDRNTMPRHLRDHLQAGHHVPGVLVVAPAMGVGQLLDELILIAVVSEPNEYQDLIVFLPLTE